MWTAGTDERKMFLVVYTPHTNIRELSMYIEEFTSERPKKHKPHKLSWEQLAMISKEKKQQERLKDKRKEGREAKRNNT